MKYAVSLLSAVAALLVATTASGAGQGRSDEVRTPGACSGGVRSELRLEADDGLLELRFEIDRTRAGARWRVVLVHERRVVWKGTLRARSGGSVRLRRALRDYPGADAVSVRAWGPSGVGCRAAATLPGA